MDFDSIDQLVEDYLKFRNYHEAFYSLQKERKLMNERNNLLKIPTNDINDRIVKALEKSDTLRLLTLWDTYVTQTLDPQNSGLVTNARITEFYLHLYCATNPFRDETLKNVKSPSEAAKYAARSMTIFKHFLETRGRRLLKTPEFQQFKNFHKVAFPPTHPSFSHMFRAAWQEMTKSKIVSFLSSYLQPPPPHLMTILNDTEQHIHSTVVKKEKEIKAVFRDREQKLMDFSRSIYAISNDLLNAIDEGGSIDKDFLYNFRLKFDEFHEVLGGAGGGNDAMNVRSKRRKRPKNKKGTHEPHYNELDYTVINLELSSMVSEVEHELTTYKKPGKRLGSIDIEIVMQSAMQGSALYLALLVYMTRDVDETQSGAIAQPQGSSGQEESYGVKQTRRYAAKKFLEYDIFGLKNPSSSSASSQLEDSTNISPRSGYMVTFLHAYAMNLEELCSHPYIPKIHHSTNKSSNEEMIENHYGELLEASSAIYHSLLLTFTVMMNTLSIRELSDYLAKYHLSESLSRVYLTLCETFLSFPTKPEILTSHVILNSIYRILLTSLVILGSERKYKLTFLKTGCMDHMVNLLTPIVSEHTSTTPQTLEDLYENHLFRLLLLYNILESSEAYRAMLSTSKASSHCLVITNYFMLLLSQYSTTSSGSSSSSTPSPGGDGGRDDVYRQIFLRVIFRGLYHLLNEKISQDILKSDMEGKLRDLNQLLTSPELEATMTSLPDSISHEIGLLSSNLIHQLEALLSAATPTGGEAGEGDGDAAAAKGSPRMKSSETDPTFITECNEIKCLLEISLSFENLFHLSLQALPEEAHIREYKTIKPKDTGMQLLMNYTKSYIEEHGSLYEGTGGTD
jgi:hypothetical protein